MGMRMHKAQIWVELIADTYRHGDEVRCRGFHVGRVLKTRPIDQGSAQFVPVTIAVPEVLLMPPGATAVVPVPEDTPDVTAVVEGTLPLGGDDGESS